MFEFLQYYMKVLMPVGYTTLLVVVVCYSAIVTKFARLRCRILVDSNYNRAASNYHRREIRLALQFAVISVLFFSAVLAEALQTPAAEIKLLLYALVVLVVGIDTP